MAPPYTVKQFIVKIYNSCMDWIFPKECAHCKREGNWLCADCLSQCQIIQSPTCPLCNRLSPQGYCCSRCWRTSPLTGARSAWYYHGPTRSYIRHLKYHGRLGSSELVVSQMVGLLHTIPQQGNTLILTSVPSPRKTLVNRGYNQSEVLARLVAQAAAVPYLPLLTRTATQARAQVHLTRKDRLANAQAQFCLRPKVPRINNATIIIIDDVLTTGATLMSCAAHLKSAGARAVWGLTIARD